MEATLTGAERRINPRYGFNFVMRFKHPAAEANPSVPSEPVEIAGTDLSVSGMGAVACPDVWGGERLQPGQKMMVKLIFEGEEEAFSAAAKVMWSRKREGAVELQQLGLKFVYVSSEALASVLARVVANRSPKT